MSNAPAAKAAPFSARFADAVKRVITIEGGFVNDPADRGGATKYGISLRFLAAELRANPALGNFDLDMDGDLDGRDIAALRVADAERIYHACFWARLRCEDLPRPIGEAVFDQGVNGGNAAAVKLLQRALNQAAPKLGLALPPLAEDGAIGAATITRAQQLAGASAGGVAAIIAQLRVAAADRYRAIVARDPSQQKFLGGWLRRAAELGSIA